MFRRVLFVCLLVSATALAFPRDKSESWIQVSSPHFIVTTNGNEKQGRRVADQFERMRSVFHVAFPNLKIDPDMPIVVLAIKDDKDFRALEPQDYLAKGSLKLGGLFMRAPDKNYVLMRLDAEGPHPYAVVYHEYTHLLTSKLSEFLPLWLNEGLAEFYQNTDIHEKDALMGEPSQENILWLRQNRLLPLPVLFAVDARSPYYHEENRGSIFYAESWALVHYLEFNDHQNNTHHITDYLNLLAKKTDPAEAAAKAFGDPAALQKTLENYIRQSSMHYLKMPTVTEVDESGFKVQSLSEPQSEALRADFLAYNGRTADAERLLDQALQADPKNVSAHETKGYLEFRQGHLEEAKNWYAKAVQLDSQSFLSHYYFATMSMSMGGDSTSQDQVEQSLRTAIRLNPGFAPAFDRLAVYLATHDKDLNEARMMGLTAVSLDPPNVGYRINVAHVLMNMNKAQSAVEVLKYAQTLAKTPQDAAMVDSALRHAQQSIETRAPTIARGADVEATVTYGKVPAGSDPPHPRLARREFVAKGPHRFVVGVLKGVHCDHPALTLKVTASGKELPLRGEDYFAIRFTTLGFQPVGDLNPCSDLENRPAKVEYVESANSGEAAQLISVELHK